VLIKNGTILTLNPQQPRLHGDLLVEADTIKAIGSVKTDATTVIDATDKIVLPGFIQTHTHLCQTLFRNQADDLKLLDWLQQRIWPLEAAHDENSITLSAQLGCAELIKCGTTTIMDMGTVRHTDCLFEVARQAGLRAFMGKALMDAANGIPVRLIEPTQNALNETLQLIQTWHQHEKGRLRYAVAPRFLLCCSNELMAAVKSIAQEQALLIHTHAAETKQEVAIIQQQTGFGNIEYLAEIGLTAPNLCLAHSIWINDREMNILQASGTRVLHCPSANLKLASGIAPIPEMLARGIPVALGADGAPCNNNLDIFMEMRLAALLQKYRLADPGVLPARQVIEMATINGARTLGLENEIGSLEVGKKADLIILNLNHVHSVPGTDLYARIVYSARPENVETVMIDGQLVMQQKQLLTLDEARIVRESQPASKRLLTRI